MPYPYLIGRRGYTMDHREIKIALGIVTEETSNRKVGPDESKPWTTIDGVEVAYYSSGVAKSFWNNYGTNTPMRAVARCPECDKITAASRINQHARAHHGGVRKGY